MKYAIVVIAAVLSACSSAQRIDQVQERQIQVGTDIKLEIITDPVSGVTCYKSISGLWCEHSVAR